MNTLGIDVSYHQGVIDWAKVKAAGIKFAILRAGYGVSTVDKQFENNVEGCIKHGIPFGVYWFIYGVNEKEAELNADMCHAVIDPYKSKLAMRVWCDLEYDTDANAKKRGVTLTKQLRTNMVISFCEKMKAHGYEVGNYANPDYLKNKFYALPQYPLWLAYYSNSEKTAKSYNPYMWQYSSKGKVNGISGNVDMNYLYAEIETEKQPAAKKEEVEEYNMPTIKKGSKGKAVKVWQVIVGVEPDGDFGSKTATATKNFQKAKGLTVDGIVGKNSWKAGLESV